MRDIGGFYHFRQASSLEPILHLEKQAQKTRFAKINPQIPLRSCEKSGKMFLMSTHARNTAQGVHRSLPEDREKQQVAVQLQQQADRLNERALQLLDSNPSLAIELSQRAIELASQGAFDIQPYQERLASGLLNLGRFYLQLSQYEEALGYLSKALAIFDLLGNVQQRARSSNYIGMVYQNLSAYPEAFEYLFKALHGAEECDDDFMKAEILNAIGYLHVQVGEAQRGLSYLQKSLKILRRFGDQPRLGWTLNSLCQAYWKLGDFPKALACGLESVRLSEKAQEWKKVTEHLYSLGEVYQAQESFTRALTCFRRSLLTAQNHGFRFDAGKALCSLGQVYGKQKRNNLALSALRQALALSEEIDAKALKIACYKSLADVYKQMDEFQNALACFERYHDLKETLFNAEADRRLKSLQVVYQVEAAQKEAEILQLRTVALEREIDRQKKAQAILQEMANTDSLTGLLNRRYFFTLAERAFNQAMARGTALSVIMLDIDHFKQVNDRYGHQVGDQLLRVIGSALRENLRKGDLIARVGGEEFVVLLPDIDLPIAVQTAERLRGLVSRQRVSTPKSDLAVTISLGVARIEADQALTLEKLLDQADQALYRAKKAGRNRVIAYKRQDTGPL